MNGNIAEVAFLAFKRSALEFQWFVNNYRHNRMFRDGRVIGLFYVEPDSKYK